MALGFSVLAAATKATGTRLSSYERIFLRSCCCVILAPVDGERSLPPLLLSPNRRLLLLRGLLGFIAVSAYYEAIARIPLATLTLISRLHPLLSTALAGLILGEPVPPLLCVRTLAVLGEPAHHAREAFHWGNLCGALALGLPRGFAWPTVNEASWILITAVSMQLAQLALTYVLRSPVVSATKYFFLNVVLNLAFGVLLGDPWPSAQETLGALVILLSIAEVAASDGLELNAAPKSTVLWQHKGTETSLPPATSGSSMRTHADTDLSQICSAIHDDPCACLEAGCVAQEVSMGSTACFAAYQPAAGRQIFAADLASECEAPFGEAVLP
eukprot:g27184.t1